MVYVLAIFGFLCAGFIVSIYFARGRNSNADKIQVLLNELPVVDGTDRVLMEVEIEKLRRSDTPWFEKSISTIGTIAFFSMVAATVIQTIDASITKEKNTILFEKKYKD